MRKQFRVLGLALVSVVLVGLASAAMALPQCYDICEVHPRQDCSQPCASGFIITNCLDSGYCPFMRTTSQAEGVCAAADPQVKAPAAQPTEAAAEPVAVATEE